jgi:Lon protease-like protein
MTTDEIKQRLFGAARVRMPSVEKDATTGMQIEQLEDYMVATAQWRADLEEALLYAEEARKRLSDQLEDLDEAEWSHHLDGKRTLAGVARARAQARPDLAQGMADAKWLVERLARQISRLEVDATWTSRIYTMRTGS